MATRQQVAALVAEAAKDVSLEKQLPAIAELARFYEKLRDDNPDNTWRPATGQLADLLVSASKTHADAVEMQREVLRVFSLLASDAGAEVLVFEKGGCDILLGAAKFAQDEAVYSYLVRLLAVSEMAAMFLPETPGAAEFLATLARQRPKDESTLVPLGDALQRALIDPQLAPAAISGGLPEELRALCAAYPKEADLAQRVVEILFRLQQHTGIVLDFAGEIAARHPEHRYLQDRLRCDVLMKQAKALVAKGEQDPSLANQHHVVTEVAAFADSIAKAPVQWSGGWQSLQKVLGTFVVAAARAHAASAEMQREAVRACAVLGSGQRAFAAFPEGSALVASVAATQTFDAALIAQLGRVFMNARTNLPAFSENGGAECLVALCKQRPADGESMQEIPNAIFTCLGAHRGKRFHMDIDVVNGFAKAVVACGGVAALLDLFRAYPDAQTLRANVLLAMRHLAPFDARGVSAVVELAKGFDSRDWNALESALDAIRAVASSADKATRDRVVTDGGAECILGMINDPLLGACADHGLCSTGAPLVAKGLGILCDVARQGDDATREQLARGPVVSTMVATLSGEPSWPCRDETPGPGSVCDLALQLLASLPKVPATPDLKGVVADARERLAKGDGCLATVAAAEQLLART